jgi:hypothetical protein
MECDVANSFDEGVDEMWSSIITWSNGLTVNGSQMIHAVRVTNVNKNVNSHVDYIGYVICSRGRVAGASWRRILTADVHHPAAISRRQAPPAVPVAGMWRRRTDGVPRPPCAQTKTLHAAKA